MVATNIDTALLYCKIADRITKGLKLPKVLQTEIDQAAEALARVDAARTGEGGKVVNAEVQRVQLVTRAVMGHAPTDEELLELTIAPARDRVMAEARRSAQDMLAATYHDAREEILAAVRSQRFEPALAKVQALAESDWTGESSGQLYEAGNDALASRVRETESAIGQIVECYRARQQLYDRHGASYKTDFGELGTWQLHSELNAPPTDDNGMPYSGWRFELDADAHLRLPKMVDALRQGATLWLPTLAEAEDARAAAPEILRERALEEMPQDQRKRFQGVTVV